MASQPLPDNDNYLFAEQVLVDKLKDVFGEPDNATLCPQQNIASIGSFEDLIDATSFAPGVYVAYTGDAPQESVGNGKANRVIQKWLVIVAVRGSSSLRTGADARRRAGQILSRVLKGLQGFKVTPDYALRRTNSSVPPVYYKDYAFHGVEFTINLDICS